jgi:hypothetical protein
MVWTLPPSTALVGDRARQPSWWRDDSPIRTEDDQPSLRLNSRVPCVTTLGLPDQPPGRPPARLGPRGTASMLGQAIRRPEPGVAQES